MILKTILQFLKDKMARREVVPQSPESPPAEGLTDGRKSGKKVKALILVTAAMAVSTAGFVLTVTVLNSLWDRRDPIAFSPLNVNRPSGTPGHSIGPQGLAESQPHSDAAAETGGERPGPAARESALPKGQVLPERSISPEKAAPIPQSNNLRKEANAKPVSEYDPFKTEFLKKYEEAEKKERKSKKRGGADPSLTDLEGAIQATPPRPSLPVQPVAALPVLPHKEKELKLTVYGVVISKGNAYAISDRGIIRTGNAVDEFTVEKVEFEMVSLKNKDDEKDIRNVYVNPKGSEGQKAGQQPSFFQPNAVQAR
ncbi:MAG: hypothetical protein M0Z71_00075 [Nitrospiraceae bacterium]|nr:hypothetical protein [Nitrospiraceae bacterium]